MQTFLADSGSLMIIFSYFVILQRTTNLIYKDEKYCIYNLINKKIINF